jgi:steroid 5-alpha reductase family enzyme
MMTLAIMLIGLAIALCGVMALAWFVAGWTGRSGWIDAIWSYAVGAGGVVTSLLPLGASDQIDARQWLVAALAALWSLRLGSHIAARTLHGGDDPRYRQLREEWGGKFRARLFWFLQIQAAAAFLLVVTILTAAHRPGDGLSYGDLLGIGIFAIAIVGEAEADRQLARFSAEPENKGKVCDTGLWAFSRHPNYFFEWLVWVAFAAIAIVGLSYGFGWLALAGPAFMYWLLVYVSGIPPLEAHMLRSRGEAFRAYQQRVNAFWPGLPATRHPAQKFEDGRS